MNQPRIPALDFAFFPMTSKHNGALLGWEVTMLDIELLHDATKHIAEQHAHSMPLLIGEVTELLEGPVLKLVVKRQLKLWLPVSYSAFSDSEWVDGLVEQLSSPAALHRGIALLVRWKDLPRPLVELRPNIDRLRVIGLRVVDASHAAMALSYRDDFASGSAEESAAGRLNGAALSAIPKGIDDIHFGGATSLANVLEQLR
jgi:hypothetical protein